MEVFILLLALLAALAGAAALLYYAVKKGLVKLPPGLPGSRKVLLNHPNATSNHVDGLTLLQYEELATIPPGGASPAAPPGAQGAQSNAREVTGTLGGMPTAKPPAAPKPAAGTRLNQFGCCASGMPKPVANMATQLMKTLSLSTGRLSRKPAAQKMQKSAGATRSAPRMVDFSSADPTKWAYPEIEYAGSYSYAVQPILESVSAPIAQGVASLKANPSGYDGLYYQSDMMTWPEDQQRYTLVKRTASGFKVKEQKGGGFNFVLAKYVVLPELTDFVKDNMTDSMTYNGLALGQPVLPGRGYGCADIPTLKIIGDVDPNDVCQGAVGDCWLLSAISAMAEFDGSISKIFRKTTDLAKLPAPTANQYTVTLYDLATWQPVDVVVDERLCQKADNAGLLGSQPSVDGELWVPYLEKAVAIHCGGWDKIDGGQCTHAWRLLTGCKFQYTFRDDGEGFKCYGTLNPNTQQWEECANSPHDGFKGLWPMAWPEAGGGGVLDLKLEAHDFFERMCAWDDNSYLMGCGSKAGSDKQNTDGIIDGHAYTILQCIDNAGGTEFDMIKLRNPWGKGEFEGKWADEGSGWTDNPEVKESCQPVKADDGVFWVDRDEFFLYFKTVYVCAQDMSEF
jgi:hypothetical protein